METKQVGVSKIIDKHTAKERPLKYSDIIQITSQWIQPNHYLPISYDLVDLWIENKRKVISGWWNNKKWIALRLRKGDLVTKWRRTESYW